MSIRRWEPFREMLTLRDAMDRLFEEAFIRPREEWPSLMREGPALDMYETDDAVKVEVPLPGVKPDEVDITVTGNELTIKGETRAKEEVEEENYYRREVRYGAFSRSVTLPQSANPDEAEAEFEGGVLTVTFPKTVEARPKQIEVKKK